MSHPPILAVAIAGVLALATVVETYHSAQRQQPGASVHADVPVTPAQQLDRALAALRLATCHNDASAM